MIPLYKKLFQYIELQESQWDAKTRTDKKKYKMNRNSEYKLIQIKTQLIA